METQDIQDIPVLKLLPQAPPFVLIDKLLHYDLVKTETSFVITPCNIFVENNKMSEYGLIENVAQTCAARMGYINYQKKDNIKLGFIGAVKNFDIVRLPEVGEELRTAIVVMEEVFQMTLVEAQVYSGNSLIASAQMKIALSDIDSKV